MSGYKHATVTISQEEYRRLHDADLKRRFSQYANIHQQASSQDDVNALIRHMENRQKELEDALASSNAYQNSSQFDTEILNDLLSRNAFYYQSMASSLQETNGNLQNSILKLTYQFNQIMEQEREYFHQRFNDLLSQQEMYQLSIYEKEEAARQWLIQCMTVLSFIQQQYDTERFTPGKLEKLYRSLNLAESNLNDGFTEASIQFSQQSYLDLSDLNSELEQVSMLWQTEYLKTISSMKRLVDEIDSNMTVKALGMDGEELANDVNLDFWSKGKYGQLLRHCQKYLEFMELEQNRLTIEDLSRIYNQILPTIRESFSSIIYEARLSALNSQLRMNIAETALQALETHGFVLDRSGYTEDDMRAEFNAHLVCADGTEISVQVLPTEKENEELTNDLVVITTHPYLKTEHEARLRWEELNQSLHQFNLNVSRPTNVDEPVLQESGRESTEQLIQQTQIHKER